MAGVSPKHFLDGITEQLGEGSASRISQDYHITPDIDENLFLTNIFHWIGDVVFDGIDAPVLSF